MNQTVSIILTTLNGARYIKPAIESCLAQTYADFELLVVDGGSTDQTLEVVAGFTDPRIRVIHQQGNQGKLPGAINLGLDCAKGDYLTWFQDDCLYAPEAIEEMVKALDEHPEAGQVYADYWVIDKDGNQTDMIRMVEPDEILTMRSDLVGVCFMLRRKVREVVGPHDVSTYPTQDYDYRLRIAMKFRSHHIPRPLYYWRLHPYSLTGSRPWTADPINDVRVRVKLGLSDEKQARMDLAGIKMAYAFDLFLHGAYEQVPAHVLAAVKLNPRHLLNRGVWSIFGRSIARSLVKRMRRG